MALTPDGIRRLVLRGFQVSVEAGLGVAAGFADSDYSAAGAELAESASQVCQQAGIVLAVNKPSDAWLQALQPKSLYISLLDPFNEKALVQALVKADISAISLEMIPRTTRAQPMDVLSSQASLAGYAAVIVAASFLPKILPMMMTPAGTLAPARVFVIGAGVAGLQAIATAKRLGARVEAFDTRPVVKEQVRSLGARFLQIDLGDVGQTEQGYAQSLSDEQTARQQEAMAKVLAASDIVITTAKLFGRPPPRLVTQAMLKAMAPASVVVDMAADKTGGNVEGSKPDEVINIQGIQVIGQSNLPATVATHASQMFSSNLVHLLEEVCSIDEEGCLLDDQNEILQGCLITHSGSLVHPALRQDEPD